MNIALTGDIGSGKSTTLSLFGEFGMVTYSADQIVHDLFRDHKQMKDEIVNAFGDDVLSNVGEIDRAVLGDIVFSDKDRRLLLESIVHPRVRETWQQGILNSGNRDVIVEIPLLFEKKLETSFDYCVSVFSSLGVKVKRLKERNLDEAAIHARLSSQMDQNTKASRSDFLILNNGSIDFLRKQIDECVTRMSSGR